MPRLDLPVEENRGGKYPLHPTDPIERSSQNTVGCRDSRERERERDLCVQVYKLKIVVVQIIANIIKL